MWSLGCVALELLLGYPLFSGSTTDDVLNSIMQVLGTPSQSQLHAMIPKESYVPPDLKSITIYKQQSWSMVLAKHKCVVDPDAKDLISNLVRYEPHLRLDPFEALAHGFFDELRDPTTRLPDGSPLPSVLFNWTTCEWKRMEAARLTTKLCPPHLFSETRERFKAVAINMTRLPSDRYLSPFSNIVQQQDHVMKLKFRFETLRAYVLSKK